MKTLHKINRIYTNEQLACMWWAETRGKYFYYFHPIDGRLTIKRGKFNHYDQRFSDEDVRICLREWERRGCPIVTPTRLKNEATT